MHLPDPIVSDYGDDIPKGNVLLWSLCKVGKLVNSGRVSPKAGNTVLDAVLPGFASVSNSGNRDISRRLCRLCQGLSSDRLHSLVLAVSTHTESKPAPSVLFR